MKHKLIKLFAVAGLLAPALWANAQNLNGTLDSSFYGSPLYVQSINTGFGNSTGGGDASGSELDAVYAQVSGGNLYLFIAGCFQNNGNHLNVFVAGGGSGQNTLAVPTTGTLKAMNGSIFTNGFQATWAFDMNDSGGTLYSEEYTLSGTASGGYVGPLTESSPGIAAGSDGGVASLYLNNTLVSGMGTGNAALTAGPNTGANTSTGLEMVIPLSAINYTGGSVNVLVDINAGGDSYLSNQFLPPLAVGASNLGGTTFNFSAIPTPTNYVTFQLDLSEQVSFGNFTNTDENTNDVDFGLPANSVAAGGSFNGFGTGDQLTNYTILNPNDSNPGLKTNLYIGTFPITGFLPTAFQWKFRVNNLDGGYEQPVSTSGGNRSTTLTNQTTILPVLSYDDLGLGDLVVSNTTVTFTLYMTNGTLTELNGGTYQYNNQSDSIYVNGPWAGWDWGISIPANQQMVEVGASDYYTNSWVFPRGSSVYVTYKYSLDGTDNENAQNTNHIREIRSYGPNYSFPTDVWSYTVLYPGCSTPYPLAGLAVTNFVEPDFGYLTIGALSGGSLPINWLGRPAVQLQNSPDLVNWNSLGATDATESTNWPNTGGNQFFRLIKN